MKIFIDSADVEAISKACETGLVDGVTTNPSYIAKSGKKFTEVVKEICTVVKGPVSVEVMAETCAGMVDEAQRVAELAPNVVVKIPMTVEGLKAVPVLEREKKIHTNVTMVFSSTQCFLAMKAGAFFVSIVLSRLDAIANESDILLKDAVTVKSNYGFTSQVLAASLKTQNHVLAALRYGADIVTIPDSLFFQLFKHPLTDAGLAAFKQDWEKVPK
jgi:transaldolase